MRSLSKSTRRPGHAGEPIPLSLRRLRDMGVEIRRGAVTMIAGESNAGKTPFALYLLASSLMPGVYFSADSDERTMRECAAAMVTGLSRDEVKLDLDAHAADLEQLDRIRWVFESDPSYGDLEHEVAAYTEAWGDFPPVVVLDNLMNVVGESDDEYGSMRETTRFLHWLARHGGCAVIVLHHMREEARADDFDPPPKKALQGKLSNFPEVILSIASEPGGPMRVAAVKNRFGPFDKTGRTYAELWPDWGRVQFYESRHERENRSVA